MSSPSGRFSEQQSFHDERALPQISYNPARRLQLSKGQWGELKPLIQQLYMEKNQTLQSVAQILSEKYKFRPTHVILLSSA